MSKPSARQTLKTRLVELSALEHFLLILHFCWPCRFENDAMYYGYRADLVQTKENWGCPSSFKKTPPPYRKWNEMFNTSISCFIVVDLRYLGVSLRAMADLVFFFKNLDPPGKTSVLVLFARIAAIFDLLGVESSSNMKWKANAKLERPCFKILVRYKFSFFKGPHDDFPPLKSSKMTTNVIWLE